MLVVILFPSLLHAILTDLILNAPVSGCHAKCLMSSLAGLELVGKGQVLSFPNQL